MYLLEFQDEILAEELKKNEYSEANGGLSDAATASTSTSNQFGANFAFLNDKPSSEPKPKENKVKNQNDSENSEIPLLLNPPLIEEEISADLSAIIDEANELDELDMMIQSAGPFQHPRSVAQNYGHGNTNMYHRQPSYHSHHHHHQVCARTMIVYFKKCESLLCCAKRFSLEFYLVLCKKEQIPFKWEI